MAEHVLRTWNKMKEIPNYELVAGELLFRRIFEIAPSTKALFRFGEDFKVGSEEMYENALFQAHAKSLLGMVNVLVLLLNKGKTSSLAGALVTLGGQHYGYGVRAVHYPIVGKALMYTLEELLQEEFTKEARSGWKQVYTVVSTGMVEGAFYEEFNDA